MKFSIETKVLLEGLTVVSVAADHRMTLPILGNVKIEAESNRVTLSATNLDLYASRTMSAQVGANGAITVPLAMLQKLVGRFTSNRTVIEATDKDVSICAGEVAARIETLSADEFPPPPMQDRSGAVTCDAQDITEPFRKVAHAMSDEPTRYNLMGINIAPAKAGNTFVATNGKRMGVFQGKKQFTADNVIAPDQFVRALLKINPKGAVSVAIIDGVISVFSETLDVSSKLIEARYPQWQNAVPSNGSQLFSCNKGELTEALKTCAIFTDATRRVEMAGRGKEIEISKEAQIKARVMGAELGGMPKMQIEFNVDYLLHAPASTDEDEVSIRCSTPNAGMVIEEGALKAVIMPMRESA